VSVADASSRSSLRIALPSHVLGRIYLFLVILALDAAILGSIVHIGLLIAPLAPIGIAAFAAFACLGYPTLKAIRQPLPFRGGFFALHLACVGAAWCAALISLHAEGPWIFFFSATISFVVLTGLTLAALACIPFRAWVETIHATGRLWLYSLLVGVAAWCLRFPLQMAWNWNVLAQGRILQVLAFRSAASVLGLILPSVIVNPASFTLGTERFCVNVEPACSGLEGLGLILVFTVAWLLFFRKENRFPQALVLIPCALAAAWLLNIARLVILILIGNAGAPQIAMVGFHSQAGWIAFTAVAYLFAMAAGKLRWVRQHPPAPSLSDSYGSSQGVLVSSGTGTWADTEKESPATAAYLVPFLAILAASFISRAASANFEWLYPLRFVAAGWAIWHYRKTYKTIRWRFGWESLAVGVAVFLIWIFPHLRAAQPTANTLGAELNQLSPLARWAWISVRIVAAVVTVPLAEELAFRGFLARRLVNRSFDGLPLGKLTVLSILISSLVFGFMHGQQWMVGTAAGLGYALLARYKGRLGDAVAAHAVSNLLLAAWVLTRGDWGLW
jgi:exosortase E/protease (VPEID-CTERM system)